MRRILPLVVTAVTLSVGVMAAPLPAPPVAFAQEVDPPGDEPVFDDGGLEIPDLGPRPDTQDGPRRAGAAPLSAPTVAETADDAPSATDVALAEARRSGRPVEVLERRTETTVTFANPDGSFTDEVSAGPLRVQRDDGGWDVVDPTFVADEEGIRPAAVPVDIVVSDGGDEALVSHTEEGTPGVGSTERQSGAQRAAAEDKTVEVSVDQPLPAPRLEGNRAIYPGAYEGSDIVVTASTVGTDVGIVIPDPGVALETYELAIDLGGLSVDQDDSGGLELSDSAGRVVGYSPPPVMFDATETDSSGLRPNPGRIGSELVERDGQTYLVVRPDPAYLADPGTRFPVTIDPTTDLFPSHDTFVYSSAPTTPNDSATSLYTGYNALTHAARTYIRFTTSSFEGKNIVAGELRVIQHASNTGCTATTLNVYEAATLSAGATWNAQPGLIGGVRGSVATAGDSTSCPAQTGTKIVPITSLVGEWAADATSSTGTVSVRSAESSTTNQWKAFYSRETIGTPILRVNYLTTPSTPTSIVPANNSTEATLTPVISGVAAGGDAGVNQKFIYSLRDANNVQLATTTDLKHPGQKSSWPVPADLLRPGQTYTWTLKACVGPLDQWCSPTTTRTFTVSPGLGAGDRPFFTYVSTGVTDRSSVRVNVASGSLVLSAVDMGIAGVNGGLRLDRTYSSVRADDSRMLGHGWSGSYTDTVRLEPRPDGSFVFHGESGETSLITKQPTGGYLTSGDLDATFTDGGGYGVYILRFNHGRGRRSAGENLYFYNSGAKKGLLYGTTNRHGQGATITYAGTTTEPLGVVDSRGRDVLFDLDGADRLVEIDDVTGDRQATYAYDGSGDLVSVTDLDGGITTYDYDADHDLTEITDPEGGVIRITYDADHRVTSLTRENGGVDETTTFAYTDPVPPGTGTTVVTDANDGDTTYTWDTANRVERVLDQLGLAQDTSYDPNSNVQSVELPGGLVTTYTWDPGNMNNLVGTEMGSGATTSAQYPTSGSGLIPYQPTSATDAQDREVVMTYDTSGNGNMTSTVNDLATENSTSATYENASGTVCGAERGQVCTTTDARGGVTTFTYDAGGHLLNVDPPGPLTGDDVTYDALSRVRTVTDGKNQTRTYDHDPLDRVVGIEYPSSVFFGYLYDANGNLVWRWDEGVVWTMDYDDANRLVEQSGPEDLAIDYDPVGNIDTLTDATGTTSYTYTPVNMVETVTDPQGAETTFSYDADHADWRDGITYPNGATVAMVHDDAGRITEVTSRDGNGTIINSDRYTFTTGSGPTLRDRALRQTWTDKNGRVTTYGYDAVNRLATVTTKLSGTTVPPSYSYTYDGNGNRRSATFNGTTRSWTYNASDQIVGAVHDANGNITSSPWGLEAASYNSLDQTTSITLDGGSPTSQSYAGTTQDHWRSSGGTDFETAAGLGITTLDDGTATSSYTREPDGGLVSMRRNGETYHYVFDGRGSVVALTDEDGLVATTYTYGPWGEPVATTGSIPNPWRWNGGYTLDGTLYKFGTRYYDTTIGRWTQPDPSGLEGNIYAFSSDDPINQSDPTGRVGAYLLELLEGGDGVQCSWVEETGVSFDFTDACANHDACYDSETSKSTCDSRFYENMKEHCAGRSHFLKPDCYATAATYYAGVSAAG